MDRGRDEECRCWSTSKHEIMHIYCTNFMARFARCRFFPRAKTTISWQACKSMPQWIKNQERLSIQRRRHGLVLVDRSNERNVIVRICLERRSRSVFAVCRQRCSGALASPSFANDTCNDRASQDGQEQCASHRQTDNEISGDGCRNNGRQ